MSDLELADNENMNIIMDKSSSPIIKLNTIDDSDSDDEFKPPPPPPPEEDEDLSIIIFMFSLSANSKSLISYNNILFFTFK